MEEHPRFSAAVIHGVLTMAAFILLFSFLLSLLHRFTALSEHSLPWLSPLLASVAMLIGGIAAGARCPNKGWLGGTLAALSFILLAFLIQFLGFNNGFASSQALIFGLYTFAAACGGMIGINVFSTSAK